MSEKVSFKPSKRYSVKKDPERQENHPNQHDDEGWWIWDEEIDVQVDWFWQKEDAEGVCERLNWDEGWNDAGKPKDGSYYCHHEMPKTGSTFKGPRG